MDAVMKIRPRGFRRSESLLIRVLRKTVENFYRQERSLKIKNSNASTAPTYKRTYDETFGHENVPKAPTKKKPESRTTGNAISADNPAKKFGIERKMIVPLKKKQTKVANQCKSTSKGKRFLYI